MTLEVIGPPGQDFIVHPPEVQLIEALPSLPPPLRPSGVFLEAAPPLGADEGNLNGYRIEQRVGRLICRLPYVEFVRQTELDSHDNGNLTDLVVGMVPGFIVSDVRVQVKSTSDGNHGFYKEVARRMREKGWQGNAGEESHYQKLEWMRKRRLVLINGGIKDYLPVTDEYIIDKFFQQVKGIANYYREFAAYLRSVGDSE